MIDYPEFFYDEDGTIDLFEWIHLKQHPVFTDILILYRLQQEEDFLLHRDLERRQLALGMIDKNTIDPNPQSYIDLTPDEGLEF